MSCTDCKCYGEKSPEMSMNSHQQECFDAAYKMLMDRLESCTKIETEVGAAIQMIKLSTRTTDLQKADRLRKKAFCTLVAADRIMSRDDRLCDSPARADAVLWIMSLLSIV